MKINLKMLRNTAGWSKQETAHKLGISTHYVASLEQGRKIPSLPMAKKIADVFGCSCIDEIIKAS